MNDFGERWRRAAEQLRQENSFGGFLKMRADGEVAAAELFNLAYMHWQAHPELRERFLASLANQPSADAQEVSRDLAAFIAKYHP